MQPASNYPISFPYGATSPPYGTQALPYHRGDDRACPVGTPIIIQGFTIGWTGNTGLTTGPHLHVQEWQGSVYATRKPQNTFKAGKVTQVEQATNTQWGKHITITIGSWNTTYCHLSRTSVSVGQTIQGVDMSKDALTKAEVLELHYAYFGGPPGVAYDYSHVGQPLQKLIADWKNNRLTLLSSMKRLGEGILILEAILPKVEVWKLETAPNYRSAFTYTKGQRFMVVAYIDTNGTRYYVSAEDALNGRTWGVNRNDVKIIGPVTPPATVVDKSTVLEYINKHLS